MTTQELQLLATTFRATAEAIRRLGDEFSEGRCTGVLVAANMAASYADRAAILVDDEIAQAEIAAIALEDSPCLIGK